jgi:putative Holliday junction resolvase
LAQIVEQRQIGLLLVGNPINMSGNEGRQSGWVRGFAEALERRTGVRVQLWDERLTTVEASRVLRSSGIGIEKRAAAVDKLSAVILLQSYLDSL